MTDGKGDEADAGRPETGHVTAQSTIVRYLALELETWENLRRLSFGAAGGGLAISFLVLQIEGARAPDVFPFDVFALIWGALLVALVLGLSSYLWRAWGLHVTINQLASLEPAQVLTVASGVSFESKAERAFIVLSVLAIGVAFVVLVVAGWSLREAPMMTSPTSTPTPLTPPS